jgi:hypothetical protein
MADEHLATYLNDHLAGSVAAIELLEHLEAAHAGTDRVRFFAELRADIQADRDELKAVMERLQITEKRVRKATAWFAGKLTELKLRLDDHTRGPLRLLESLEAVGLGIEGKLALWRALSVAAETVPRLQGVDYVRLVQRAEEQRRRVEEARLQAAKAAFAASR